MDRLLAVVLEEARARRAAAARSAEDASRAVLAAAEGHVAELERAGRELGRTRGVAVEASLQRAAEIEVRGVLDGAFDRLLERFHQRVRLALEALPKEPDRYRRALDRWAAEVRDAQQGPLDVVSAPGDRESVYAALLEAGVEDFEVRADHRVHVGFVARDLDGRTVLDRRPEATVEAHREALKALLAARVPSPPADGAPGSAGP